MGCHRFAVVGFAALIVTVSLLAAGCGGGSSPSVANLGTTTDKAPARTTTTGSAAGGLSPAANAGNVSSGLRSAITGGGSLKQLTQYAACMRKNGAPTFPDPNAQGEFSFSSASGFDPRSPAFARAQQACRNILPTSVQPSPAQQAQGRTALVALAQCIRKHGYPNFPDPGSQGAFELRGASGVDPNSPQFQSAMSTCRPSNGKAPPSIVVKGTSPGGKP
jgi:hypothetical protein